MILYNFPMNVLFYANSADNTHCVQACLKSILKFFLPDKEFSFKQLDQMTRKIEDKGTWFFTIFPDLIKQGFDIVQIENFDYLRFYQEGKAYLYQALPQHRADWYFNNSNLMAVKDDIKDSFKNVNLQVRPATLKDFEGLLSQGYLIITDINYHALMEEPGYDSHSVVIYAFDDKHFFLHNPGLPPRSNVKVTKELLKKAGADNLTAFKYSAR